LSFGFGVSGLGLNAMQYFIAIVAPDEINNQVLVYKKYMEQHYGCKVALRSPAHITLIPPFSMKSENEDELGQYLQKFSGTQKNFSIRINNFDHFKPRVIFLHVEPDGPLLQLKENLDVYLLALKKFPIKKEERPFHPHITIANRDLQKKDFPKAWAHFQTLSFSTDFPAENISLLKHNNTNWEVARSFVLS
jgi:2'-5' RNA ligase